MHDKKYYLTDAFAEDDLAESGDSASGDLDELEDELDDLLEDDWDNDDDDELELVFDPDLMGDDFEE